jgi:hypothetical protein
MKPESLCCVGKATYKGRRIPCCMIGGVRLTLSRAKLIYVIFRNTFPTFNKIHTAATK